jgi:hypothetical protein
MKTIDYLKLKGDTKAILTTMNNIKRKLKPSMVRVYFQKQD